MCENIKDKIKGNFLYRRRFDIKCVVYEGTSLKTAKKHVQSVHSPDNDIFGILFKAAIFAVVGTPFLVAKAVIDFISGDFNIDDYADVFENDYGIELGAQIWTEITFRLSAP